jgi:hypothetical protein
VVGDFRAVECWKFGIDGIHVFDFPSRIDERLMGKFHLAPWPERYALAQGFEDSRYREFAERIIFAEHPQGLPEDRRSALAEWCSSRLSTDDETSWMTFTKAAAELESLRGEHTVASPELFGEIEAYLTGFKSEGSAT